jgi:putative DNA primase/helicase
LTTTEGKTTCVRAGCSVWGGANYMRSWQSTANGIEAAAVLFNDGLLCLDELGQADPWEVSQVIYFLANGQGKQRANRYGAARRIHRWNVIVLSTGEHSIETHLEQKCIQAKAGQSVRLLNVPRLWPARCLQQPARLRVGARIFGFDAKPGAEILRKGRPGFSGMACQPKIC